MKDWMVTAAVAANLGAAIVGCMCMAESGNVILMALAVLWLAGAAALCRRYSYLLQDEDEE